MRTSRKRRMSRALRLALTCWSSEAKMDFGPESRIFLADAKGSPDRVWVKFTRVFTALFLVQGVAGASVAGYGCYQCLC